MELIIRKGTAADVDDLEFLEQQCFAVPWSRESLLHDLAENPLAVYYVAELAGKVIGYVGVWIIAGEGHITNVAVSPAQRRCGVASAIIRTMLQETCAQGVSRHTLEVRAGNEPALALYRHFGFTSAGIRKGYYEDNGEDAVIMWREDTEA